jgi:hypothetical protein
MSRERGPYTDVCGFERWHDISGVYRRRFTDVLTAVVNYLPGSDDKNGGWGYVLLLEGMVVSGRYDEEWTARDAMVAAVAKVEMSHNP